MTRMSREFSLVLLGAGLLGAGYFLWPEEQPGQLPEAQASDGSTTGTSHSSNTHHRTYHGMHIIMLPVFGSSSPAAGPAVARGGFGRSGSFGFSGIG